MTQDFLIIGGGIAGVSAAARLAHLGSVTLLEGETALGYHASGRSAAMFEPGYGAPATVALNRASQSYHETANGGVLSPRGVLLLAGAGEDAVFEADLETLSFSELPVREACALVPILNPAKVMRAALTEQAWDIDTDLLLQNFAREARGNGARFVTGAAVTAIARTATGWSLTTSAGVFEGRTLVNAAGAWADRIAALAGLPTIGLQPCRRSMARLPAPGGHDVTCWPMLLAAGETWYAKPDAGKWLVSPADEDPVEPHDAWADDMVLAEGLARYEAMVTTPVTRIEANWAGLRSFTPDRTLAIGPDPLDPAFVWCAGQGGQGFQTAPAASALLAETLKSKAPEIGEDIARALSPARFRQTGPQA